MNKENQRKTDGQSGSTRVVNEGINRGLFVVTVIMIMAVIAVIYWGFSERAHANELAVSLEDAKKRAETLSIAATLENHNAETTGWSEANLAAFKSAFVSGKYDQVRALFTEDG